ncbi:MAG TPA: phage major capsid protein, partial [Candidatus Limnocylindrales bacterium]|nr:phage major capsid protein [Candidatus Limnocylindrales bacterium]
TLGTIARIYDISKQYARFSAGAAEQDVMDELTKAAILGENYYLIAGAGSGSVGTGDPTTGVYTSLNATPSFLSYKSAFSSASSSTLAGSFANACVSLISSLAGRNREASGIVVDSTTFFTAIGQGSDTAGFWVDPTGGPTGFTRTESGGLAFWGVPIYYDTNLGTNAATKIAIAADWKAFKLYRGMEFRIDSSDVAGDRWDKNLIGFRGEEEIGFNAETAVHAGAAQLLTAVIP